MLHAEKLNQDPRVIHAKQELQQALQEHQKTLQLQPADPLRKQSYKALLASFEKSRGNPLWFPYIGSGFGRGPLVELLDGSVKFDFITGIGPNYLGHCHPDLLKAGIEASLSNTIMQGNLQQNSDSLELMEGLCNAAKMDHCFLTTSGAMANENALKILFQKKAPAQRILAFERCFAGRTLALSQLSDKPGYREGLPPSLIVDYIPFEDGLSILEKHLTRYPKGYAAMCFELVQGDGGFYAGNRDYFIALMKLLKAHDVAIFVDEIQTFGRTPSLFAFQHYGLEEYVDVVTVGKMLQACATLFTKEFHPKPNLLSQTFTSSTIAIRAGNVILKNLLQGDLFGADGKIARIHSHIVAKLKKLPVDGPFGIGAMIAFTPRTDATKLVHRLFEEGVIAFVAGSHPTRVRFLLPAPAITFDEIDQAMEIVSRVIREA